MNRSLIYVCSLIVFFVMWGVFGFVAASPRAAPDPQIHALPKSHTAVVPAATNTEGIAVTGSTRPPLRVLLIYGTIVLTLLISVLALLNTMNRPSTTYVHHKEAPDETHKE